MWTRLLAGTAMLALVAACGTRDAQQSASADSLSRDLQLAPADTSATLNDQPAPEATPPAQAAPARKPQPKPQPRPQPEQPAARPVQKPVAPAPSVLPAGTVIQAAATDSISSRHNKPGESMTASVGSDIRDARGQVVIPAGSVITFTIAELAPAENKSAKDGKLALTPTSVRINGEDHPLSASVDSVEHYLKGRGVTAGDAAKVGAGAVGGAIAGRILGGKQGTVIGGAVGAAVGTGVAVETADRDVVIPAGATILITLKEVFALN